MSNVKFAYYKVAKFVLNTCKTSCLDKNTLIVIYIYIFPLIFADFIHRVYLRLFSDEKKLQRAFKRCTTQQSISRHQNKVVMKFISYFFLTLFKHVYIWIYNYYLLGGRLTISKMRNLAMHTLSGAKEILFASCEQF